jgi:hypothetical protein
MRDPDPESCAEPDRDVVADVRIRAPSDLTRLRIGNRAMGVLLTRAAAGIPRNAVVHPAVAAARASSRALQRDVDRDALLKAFWDAVHAAETDPARWDEVAERLNGFNDDDVRMLSKALGASQLAGTMRAVELHLAGWGRQSWLLTTLQAAANAKGAPVRPSGKRFLDAYLPVSYDAMSYFIAPTDPAYAAQRNKVWELIGGSVGAMFGAKDPAAPILDEKAGTPAHTCAARISYALDRTAGQTITSGRIFPNNPKVTYAGKPGDGMNYLVGAPDIQKLFTARFGKPDKTITTNADAVAIRAGLSGDAIAVFAGPHHTGVISPKLTNGKEYIYFDPGVLPADAWILP